MWTAISAGIHCSHVIQEQCDLPAAELDNFSSFHLKLIQASRNTVYFFVVTHSVVFGTKGLGRGKREVRSNCVRTRWLRVYSLEASRVG